MVCDGGGFFARLAAEAGANYLDVMAASHDATLRAAVREADKRSVKVIADTITRGDPGVNLAPFAPDRWR